MSAEVAGRIAAILRDRFAPERLDLEDDSERHAGHRGATSGGGHYRVTIVSPGFRGQTLLERHRAVNDAVRSMFGDDIHALALITLTPEEWKERGGGS